MGDYVFLAVTDTETGMRNRELFEGSKAWRLQRVALADENMQSHGTMGRLTQFSSRPKEVA